MDKTLENIYNSYRIRLCLFAYRIVHSQEDAEDIVHNVFLKIYEKREGEINISSFKPYIYKAVYNACMNFLKFERKEAIEGEEKSFVDENEDFLLKRVEDEVLWELINAVEKLPTKCKQVFKMSYMKNLSNSEIARFLKISVNTVKSQKQRAKQLLRAELKDLFVLLMLFLQDY